MNNKILRPRNVRLVVVKGKTVYVAEKMYQSLCMAKVEELVVYMTDPSEKIRELAELFFKRKTAAL